MSAPGVPPALSVVPPFMPKYTHDIPLILNMVPSSVTISSYGILHTLSIFPPSMPVSKYGISSLGVQHSKILPPGKITIDQIYFPSVTLSIVMSFEEQTRFITSVGSTKVSGS